MDNFYKNKNILITGGTGSLGKCIAKKLIKLDANVHVLSRDEFKQWYLKYRCKIDCKFFLGDIRDKNIDKYFYNIDIVFHTAAIKHIDLVEKNTDYAVDVNVNGTRNIIELCLKHNIKHLVSVSTDKSCIPTNAYGSSKLLVERLTINSNKLNNILQSSAIRFGNIFASRGSVAHVFNEILVFSKEKKLTLFNNQMTRFTLTINEAADHCLQVPLKGKGGDIYIPKCEKYKILDLAKAFLEVYLEKEIDDEKLSEYLILKKLRVSEKIHEDIIYKYEFCNLIDNDTFYLAFTDCNNIPSDSILKDSFNYSSETCESIEYKKLKNLITEFKKAREENRYLW